MHEGFESVRQSYAERDRQSTGDWRSSRYHPRHPLGRLFAAHNREVLIDLLNDQEIELRELTVLDVGCGGGHWLRQLVELGASPANLTGVDLSARRIGIARHMNPAINWIEGAMLPEAKFDLVMQVLVFSSVPDEGLRRELARQMNRAVKPGGRILWVDLKPLDPGMATFSREQAQSYFPGASLVYERPIHPRYFRRWYNRPWLATSLYRLTRAFCESWLLLFTKR